MNERWRRLRLIGGRVTPLLVLAAVFALLHAVGVLPREDAHAIRGIVIGIFVLGFLVGPGFVRLGRSLNFERTARIREQERAELAAHLHDSVLQTLALIQKRAGDAGAVAKLARHQERELRRWLFERPGARGGDSVKQRLEMAAVEVEELHGVPIEAVVVGDGPLDTRLDALVQAAREAMTNAAKFAGAERVDLYAEIAPPQVQVYVRDRGIGFDPDTIPVDRRGVRESILKRMERHGGRGLIHSTPGQGTEVELSMEGVPT
ncbi:MAG TPA: ATP-binding protein [Solirubrobacteraceae bacterium]